MNNVERLLLPDLDNYPQIVRDLIEVIPLEKYGRNGVWNGKSVKDLLSEVDRGDCIIERFDFGNGFVRRVRNVYVTLPITGKTLWVSGRFDKDPKSLAILLLEGKLSQNIDPDFVVLVDKCTESWYGDRPDPNTYPGIYTIQERFEFELLRNSGMLEV